MNLRLALLVPVALMASGCAAHSYCSKPGPYEKAETVPAIASAEGLSFKPSPNAFIIPAPPPNPQPFGTLVKDAKTGRKEWQCLDQPPAFTAGMATRVTEATPTPPIK